MGSLLYLVPVVFQQGIGKRRLDDDLLEADHVGDQEQVDAKETEQAMSKGRRLRGMD
jgi:hypothetical protein